MPPRKSNPNRRKYVAKKPSMAKAKAMVTKQHRRKASKNQDNFFFKAKTVGMITPSQGVTVSNYVWFSPQLCDAVSSWGVTQNKEFNLYRTLYDKVRINSMKVTITPRANTLDQALAQQDSSYRVAGDGVIHTAIDRDGQIPANTERITRMPSYRKYSVMKKFSRTYSVKYPTGIWLDCQNIYEDNTLMNRLGLFGGIGFYGENFIEDIGEIFNEPWAEAVIEYNCVFQGKTSASLSVAQDGTITIKPDTQVLTVPTVTFEAIRGSLAGDKRYDLSGNLVSVTDSDLP